MKFGFLILLIVGVPVYLYVFHYDYISQFSSIEDIKNVINSNNQQSIIIYLAAQVIQIIICVIPGQWLQFAAGVAWGFWPAYFLSILGAFMGSVLTYYIAKFLGTEALEIIFGKDKIIEYTEKLNSNTGVLILFLIYLVPGLPKDLCNYAAGLSGIKLRTFLFVSLVGRTPGMIFSILIGKNVENGSYTAAVIIAVVVSIIFVLSILFRNRIFSFSKSATDKVDRDDESSGDDIQSEENSDVNKEGEQEEGE